MTASFSYSTGIAYSQRKENGTTLPVAFSWPAGENLSLQEAQEFYRDLSRALGVASYLESVRQEAVPADSSKSLQEIFRLDDTTLQA